MSLGNFRFFDMGFIPWEGYRRFPGAVLRRANWISAHMEPSGHTFHMSSTKEYFSSPVNKLVLDVWTRLLHESLRKVLVKHNHHDLSQVGLQTYILLSVGRNMMQWVPVWETHTANGLRHLGTCAHKLQTVFENRLAHKICEALIFLHSEAYVDDVHSCTHWQMYTSVKVLYW